MLGISNKNPKYIDKKECFNLYLQLGSLGNVMRYFQNKGFVSPVTGRPPTRQSIKNAAFTYIMLNIPDAKVRLDDYYLSKGIEWDDEKFNQLLIVHGSKVLSRTSFFRIMREQGLYDRAVGYLDGLA